MTPAQPENPFTLLALKLKNLRCLVVGAGAVGTRKAESLLNAGAQVKVVAPRATPGLHFLAQSRKIKLCLRAYRPQDLEGVHLVVAATSDKELNRRISKQAAEKNILHCNASDAASSNVIFPACTSINSLKVAVTSSGNALPEAVRLRDAIERVFLHSPASSDLHPAHPQPVVWFVGAGPGAPDLITLRAKEVLKQAQVVIADYLVPVEMFAEKNLFPQEAEIVHLPEGSRKERLRVLQSSLTEALRAGKSVARLKNGDPGVFACLTEEIPIVENLGANWEVVPGLSSATAALTLSGRPVSRRLSGRSFAVTSARVAGGRVNDKLPQADSLLFLMGAASLESLTSELLRKGFAPRTPSCVIERAGLPWERRISAPLAKLAKKAEAFSVKPPALVAVGPAALPVSPKRPTILFTGTDPTRFRSLGELLHWPAHKIIERRTALRQTTAAAQELRSGRFAATVFADPAGVDIFFQNLRKIGFDARIFASTHLIAARRSSASRLAEYGLRPDSLAEAPQAGSVLSAFGGKLSGKRLLYISGIHAITGLGRSARAGGASVTRVNLARLIPHPELGRPLPPFDVIYFVSPSAVRVYAGIYGRSAFRGKVWCLGEATCERVRREGFEATLVPPPELSEHTALKELPL